MIINGLHWVFVVIGVLIIFHFYLLWFDFEGNTNKMNALYMKNNLNVISKEILWKYDIHKLYYIVKI